MVPFVSLYVVWAQRKAFRDEAGVPCWRGVVWVALFSTLAGLIYGAWVDGAGLWSLLGYLALLLVVLAGALYLIGRRNRPYGAASVTVSGK